MQWLNYWEEESHFVSVSCMHLIELKQQKLTDNIPQPIFVVTYWCTLNLNILVDAPSFFSVLIARLSVAFWLIWGSISHFFEICVCQNIASTSVYVKKQNKTKRDSQIHICSHLQKQFPLILLGIVPPVRTTPVRLLRQERSSKPAKRKPRCLRQQLRVKGTGERWDPRAPKGTHKLGELLAAL